MSSISLVAESVWWLVVPGRSNSPPLALGDCRAVTFAPHNTQYGRLHAHLQLSGIDTDASRNYWADVRTAARPSGDGEASPPSPVKPSETGKEDGDEGKAGGGDGSGVSESGVSLLDPGAFVLRSAPFAFAEDEKRGLPVRNTQPPPSPPALCLNL